MCLCRCVSVCVGMRSQNLCQIEKDPELLSRAISPRCPKEGTSPRDTEEFTQDHGEQKTESAGAWSPDDVCTSCIPRIGPTADVSSEREATTGFGAYWRHKGGCFSLPGLTWVA